jgi:hypothetical protein
MRLSVLPAARDNRQLHEAAAVGNGLMGRIRRETRQRDDPGLGLAS